MHPFEAHTKGKHPVVVCIIWATNRNWQTNCLKQGRQHSLISFIRKVMKVNEQNAKLFYKPSDRLCVPGGRVAATRAGDSRIAYQSSRTSDLKIAVLVGFVLLRLLGRKQPGTNASQQAVGRGRLFPQRGWSSQQAVGRGRLFPQRGWPSQQAVGRGRLFCQRVWPSQQAVGRGTLFPQRGWPSQQAVGRGRLFSQRG